MPQYILLAVGQVKNKSYKALEEDYLQRLSHYIPCQLLTVKDSKHKEASKKIKQESELIFQKLKKDDFLIVLDKEGKKFSSEDLARGIQKINNRGIRRLVMVIGGAYGVSKELKNRAQALWSLSTLTLPHELSRVVLLEQLYRAHTILRGEKYHH